MKNLKRALSLLLVAMMVCTCATGLVYADDQSPDYSKYTAGTGYVAFGDSITRGYHATTLDYWKEYGCRIDNYVDDTSNSDYWYYRNCRIVEGAVPYLVAQKIGITNIDKDILNKNQLYWPIAANGITTSVLCDLFGIDDGLVDTEFALKNSYLTNRYKTFLHYFGKSGLSYAQDRKTRCTSDGESVPVDSLVKGAGLISIQVGMSDIFDRSREIVLENTDISKLDAISTVGAVGAIVEKMYEGYEYWLKAFPMLLDYFKENNSDCTVVIIGAYNPIFNMKLTDDTLLPIGTALSTITSLMNKHYRQWAEEYGYLYLDISNVEIGTVENDVSFVEFMQMNNADMGTTTHPTPTGYTQIFDGFMNLLNQNAQKVEKKDISIDMGRIKSISSVLLDGVPLNKSQYDYSNNVLTVHAPTKLAKNLTVTSVTGTSLLSTKIAVSTYQLSYHDGYSAYRIYTTNSILKTGSSIKDSITSALEKKGLTLKN